MDVQKDSKAEEGKEGGGNERPVPVCQTFGVECVFVKLCGGGGSCQRSQKPTFKPKSRRSNRYKLLLMSKESSVDQTSSSSNMEMLDLLCTELLPGLDSEKCHPALAGVNRPRHALIPPLTVKTTAAAGVLINFPLNRSSLSDVICSPAELQSNHLTCSDSFSNYSSPLSESDVDIDSHSSWSSPYDISPRSGSNSEIGSGRVRSPSCREGERPQTSSNYSIESQSPHGRTIDSEFEFEDGPSSSFPDRYSFKRCSKAYSADQTQAGCRLRSRDHDFCTTGSTTATFSEITGSMLERERETCYQLPKTYIDKLMQNSCNEKSGLQNELRATRRRIVNWIFQVVGLLDLSFLAAAHAVSLLDRYLSHTLFSIQQGKTNIPLAAAACIWITAKLEDTSAADRYLPCIRGLCLYEFEEERIRQMEVSVLKCLGWRMLGATACDFLATMIAQLPAFGLPSHVLQPVGDRSEQIIQEILSEVEHLAYQPSVVGVSVMQYLLEECAPTHTAYIMEAFCLALKLDMV
ncbi:hypothetical protein R1sor_014894 [Riccia sorocarpa]|uniref:Cyclin-like domain-containing protein n=1 Tax=Riccia sorocarpa TaxID=122646 RepID=A0ABD3HDW0_9MARC